MPLLYPAASEAWLGIADMPAHLALVGGFRRVLVVGGVLSVFGGWGVSCCQVAAVLVVRLGFVLMVVLLAVRRRVWLWLLGIRAWR